MASIEKIADWSYALFTEGKEQYRNRLKEALLSLMRAGNGDELLQGLNRYAERVAPRFEKDPWARHRAGQQYWDLCYDLAQRVPLVADEVTHQDEKVVSLKGQQPVASEVVRSLVAIPIAFPVRSVLDGGMDLQLDRLNEALQKAYGVKGHWFPGLVDDYPVAELHIVEWLKVHDELFYERLPEARYEELRFDAQRRADRFHYKNSDEYWDWDFLVVMGSVEGQWSQEAQDAVREHLQEVVKADREDVFEVGKMDYLRLAQYQGGWIAKQRAVDDFLNRTKGPFRLERMEGGLLHGWVLGNGSKNWVHITPDMHQKSWDACLMMLWEAFERNGLRVVHIGREPQKPGVVPSFVRY